MAVSKDADRSLDADCRFCRYGVRRGEKISTEVISAFAVGLLDYRPPCAGSGRREVRGHLDLDPCGVAAHDAVDCRVEDICVVGQDKRDIYTLEKCELGRV